MPVFTPSLPTHQIAGTRYGFSAIRPIDVGAPEQTLVVVCADRSASVNAFAPEIERCVGQIVESCSQHPRADNLLLRVVTFSDELTEVHGFAPLAGCDPARYTGTIRDGGCTALFDATLNAVGSIAHYGRELDDHDFEVNGIAFVITDGMDNASTAKPNAIEKAISAARRSKALESLVTVLVGVGIDDANLSAALRRFHLEAGFSEYVELRQADAGTLARLAGMVATSIATQSVALSRSNLSGIGF